MGDSLCIATWNVNSIKARLPLVLRWLREANPDIVALQEIKTENATFPYMAFEDSAYNIAVNGKKTYNGVAILSKFPIEDVWTALEDEDQGRYIETVTGGVRVASVYVPNGQSINSPPFFYKKNFFQKLTEHVKKRLTWDELFIIAGDYNVAPSHEDVHDTYGDDESLLCTGQERSWWHALLHLGLTDPHAHNPEKQKKNPFTWWDYRARCWAQGQGLRIDHCLLSPRAADSLAHCGVDAHVRSWERPSDHAPVWVRLMPIQIYGPYSCKAHGHGVTLDLPQNECR